LNPPRRPTWTRRLHVGTGFVDNVPSTVWAYTVSGNQVLRSCFSYRRRNRERPLIGCRRPPSPLGDIQPDHWLADRAVAAVRIRPTCDANLQAWFTQQRDIGQPTDGGDGDDAVNEFARTITPFCTGSRMSAIGQLPTGSFPAAMTQLRTWRKPVSSPNICHLFISSRAASETTKPIAPLIVQCSHAVEYAGDIPREPATT